MLIVGCNVGGNCAFVGELVTGILCVGEFVSGMLAVVGCLVGVTTEVVGELDTRVETGALVGDLVPAVPIVGCLVCVGRLVGVLVGMFTDGFAIVGLCVGARFGLLVGINVGASDKTVAISSVISTRSSSLAFKSSSGETPVCRARHVSGTVLIEEGPLQNGLSGNV